MHERVAGTRGRFDENLFCCLSPATQRGGVSIAKLRLQ
jgi:hypothetical protein